MIGSKNSLLRLYMYNNTSNFCTLSSNLKSTQLTHKPGTLNLKSAILNLNFHPLPSHVPRHVPCQQ